MYIPKLGKEYIEGSVAIFGNGVSGGAVSGFLTELKVPYIIYDKKGAEGVCTDFSKDCLIKHNLVIYSPGFSPEHPWLKLAEEGGCLCLSELDFGALFWKGKIIAVTGTNGKSTSTQLLANALKKFGIRAVACGNIGSPLTSHCRDAEDCATAVCEVSSFQAETLKYFAPDVLIWTNFDEDHLDRHPSLVDYFDAKWKLVSCLKSTDLFIGESVLNFAVKHGYEFPREVTVIKEEEIESATFLPAGIFSAPPQAENYLLALAFWKSQGFDIEVLESTAVGFESLPYRFVQIAKVGGISFWNDSKGTNFSATIAALKRFKSPIFWIGGGKKKGGDIEAFVSKISSYVQEAFLIGEAAEDLVEAFKKYNISALIFESLEDATGSAYERGLLWENQDIVFSPGFSSFDMFVNAEERGKFFEKKVLELKTAQNTLETILTH